MSQLPDQNLPFESSVPFPLRDLYLRFHEKDLCQELDAVFVFHPKGVEIWCRIEDERSYQRFSEMIDPLRAAFEIEVYATSPAANEKAKDDEDPPPSLWNNSALVGYLQEGGPRNMVGSQEAPESFPGGSRRFVKQRLLMWSNQILSWNKKVRRYAADLPGLAGLGFGSGADLDMKSRAASICLAHVQTLDKNLARITENLAQALPKPDKAARRAEGNDKTKTSMPSSKLELASLVSTRSLAMTRRIHRFIYPENFTVGLSDLKDPDLLESLRGLRKTIAEFSRAGGSVRFPSFD